MTSDATPWQRDGRTVYALQAEPYGFHKGVPQYRNRFSAHVQDALTPDVELERIARLIAAAPDVIAKAIAFLAAYDATFASDVMDKFDPDLSMQVNAAEVVAADELRAAIAKAEG